MTYQADRTYWRMSSTTYLIDAARHSGHELAIALVERLEEYEHQEATIDDLIRENAEFKAMVESRDDDIAYLRAQLGLD